MQTLIGWHLNLQDVLLTLPHAFAGTLDTGPGGKRAGYKWVHHEAHPQGAFKRSIRL